MMVIFMIDYSGEGEPAKIHDFGFNRLPTGMLLVKEDKAPL